MNVYDKLIQINKKCENKSTSFGQKNQWPQLVSKVKVKPVKSYPASATRNCDHQVSLINIALNKTLHVSLMHRSGKRTAVLSQGSHLAVEPGLLHHLRKTHTENWDLQPNHVLQLWQRGLDTNKVSSWYQTKQLINHTVITRMMLNSMLVKC